MWKIRFEAIGVIFYHLLALKCPAKKVDASMYEIIGKSRDISFHEFSFVPSFSMIVIFFKEERCILCQYPR